MKKIFLIVITILGFITIGFSQPCLPDGITFTTQAQVDNFPINYPNCSEIDGGIIIHGNDITNLDSLIQITSISDDLLIGPTNPSLVSIEGLSNLNKIGGRLAIEDNISLISLNGLQNLDTISGSFNTNGCTFLESLSGLNSLKSCGYVQLWNTNLNNLEGLDSLSTINGHFEISYNFKLLDLAGINRLKLIKGGLWISWNFDLESLNGLDSLQFIDGGLMIWDNDIANLDALINLDSINGNLGILNEYDITDISGLNNVEASSINSLGISNNPDLTICNAESICEYLSAPNGTVSIYNNGSGCDSPGEIAESCEIELSCLPFGNYFFNKQSAIDNFQTDYPDCDTLNGLVFIEGDDIVDLSGLDNVSCIIGDLIFMNNPLTSLNGLQKLEKVQGSLYIGGYEEWPYFMEGNHYLDDITALSNLTWVGDGIVVGYNNSLSDCDIQIICEHISSNEEIEIHNNAVGCNSVEEVEEDCLTTTNQLVFYESLVLQPNPFTTSTTLEYQLDQPETVILTIFNHLGEQVDLILQHQQSGKQSLTWQPQGLPPGMYYFTLHAEGQVSTGKMVMLK